MSLWEMVREHPIYILWIWLLIINLVELAVMGIDKLLSKRGSRRVPEATLFLMALIGGSLGGILGMYTFRHKTKHKTFVIGFPMILVLQIALAILLVRVL
ncbi:MAG: DUF1294 domain-containing protein [Eubacteriales bacterium]|nr:DUF1294 domain-containing protein [Eubacteriales bacterium]